MPPRKLTRAQHIAQTMSSMGFRPNWSNASNHVEYVKDFAEANGRMARLAVCFSKAGFMQVMDQARLVQFVVTVQGTVDPLIDEVKTKAPPALQADMLAALAKLEGLQEPETDPSANCDLCGALLEEWTVDDEGRIQCMRPDVCPQRDPSVPDEDEEDELA
jgi:hypothetical protein